MKRVANRAFDALVATRSSIVRTCAMGIGGSAAAIGALDRREQRGDVSRFERMTNCIVPNVRYGFCVYGGSFRAAASR